MDNQPAGRTGQVKDVGRASNGKGTVMWNENDEEVEQTYPDPNVYNVYAPGMTEEKLNDLIRDFQDVGDECCPT